MFYRLCRWICHIFLRLFYRLEIKGAENLPSKGGAVIVANHANFFDPVIIGCCFKRKVHFMAKEELFRIPLLGTLIRFLGAYPIRRGAADKTAFATSFRLLEAGRVIALFPEGTRFKDGKLHPLRPGAAVLALRGTYPLIPVMIKNSNLVKLFRFPKISVDVGPPFSVPLDLTVGSEKEKVRRAIAYIQGRMAALWETGPPDATFSGQS